MRTGVLLLHDKTPLTNTAMPVELVIHGPSVSIAILEDFVAHTSTL